MRTAPASAAPEEWPTSNPSSLASFSEVSQASSVCMAITPSSSSGLKMGGTSELAMCLSPSSPWSASSGSTAQISMSRR